MNGTSNRLSALVSLILLMLPGTAAADDRYKEVVALQNRAQASLPNRLNESLRDQLASIEIAVQLERPRLVAVLYQRLGETLESDGSIQRALTAYESGLKALSGDGSTTIAADLQSIGSVAKGSSGGTATAPADLYSARVAGDLDRAAADPALVVNLLLAIGNAYLQQPQPVPARNAYERALKRPEIAEMPRLRAYALANLGEVQRRTGETEAAFRTLTDALTLLRASAPPVESRRALVLIAGIHRDFGRMREAVAAYREALALYEQVEDTRGQGRAYAALGLLQLRQKDYQEAKHAYARSIELGEPLHDVESLWHAYWGLGQARRATGDLDGAATALERSLSLIEGRRQELATDEGKITLLDSASQAFDELLTVHLARAVSNPRSYRDALAVAERARAGAMYDLMGSTAMGRRQLRCGPLRSITDASDPLSRIPAANAAPSTPSRSHEELDVSQMAPAVPSRPSPSPMAQMAPAVPSQAAPATRVADPRCADPERPRTVQTAPLARLVFHVLDDRTVVFAVARSGDVRAYERTLTRQALTERVGQLRDALGVDTVGRGVSVEGAAQTTADYRALLRTLYDDFIGPIADAFPPGEPLVIEPHGPLWLVPFAALLAPDGAWFGDRWPVLYAPSSQVLDEIRQEVAFQRPADIRALIVGNPMPPPPIKAQEDLFRGHLRAAFQPLPGAEEEAKTIAGLLSSSQTRLLIGPAATLDSVSAAVPDYTVIHLASHALASASNPLDSFVMLAPSPDRDDRLTARKVLSLSFGADLVTLSACQTGLGQLSGDGVIGLSRAFLARGARSVLVSQWSVHDAATSALMRAFYQTYVAGEGDKAAALQSAMQQVRGHAGFEHPRFWAAFMLVGSER
jgi:CHAT domain-containing protein/tetratricopeptide (TPR) repeat protein